MLYCQCAAAPVVVARCPVPGATKKEKSSSDYENIDSFPIYFEYGTCCLGSTGRVPHPAPSRPALGLALP